jgi:hypothetical protein
MTQLIEGQTSEAQPFTPSASFRATMDAVTGGETDEQKLRDIATDTRSNKTSDPVPDADTAAAAAATKAAEQAAVDQAAADEAAAEQAAAEGEGEGTETLTPDDEAAKREAARAKLSSEKPAEKTEDDDLRGVHPNDPTRFQKRVNNYEAIITKKDETVASLNAELDTLRERMTQIETVGAPEQIKEQLDELKQYRRRYAIERDPEFQQRFQSKIEESNELMDEALTSAGVSDKMRKHIKDMGGVASFLKSGDKIRFTEPGSTKIQDLTPGEYIAKAIANARGRAPDAVAIFDSELAAQRRLEKEKAKFMEGETKEAKEYFDKIENREAELSKLGETAEQELEKVITSFKTTVHGQDWMKDLKVAQDASEDIKAAISTDNAFRKQLREYFDLQTQIPAIREAAKRTTTQQQADELARVVIDSARVFHVERELKAEKARADELQKQLDAARRGGRSTPIKKTTGGRTPPTDTSGEPKRADFDSDLRYGIALTRWQTANGIPLTA